MSIRTIAKSFNKDDIFYIEFGKPAVKFLYTYALLHHADEIQRAKILSK